MQDFAGLAVLHTLVFFNIMIALIVIDFLEEALLNQGLFFWGGGGKDILLHYVIWIPLILCFFFFVFLYSSIPVLFFARPCSTRISGAILM